MRIHPEFYNEDYFSGRTSSYQGGYKDEPAKWDKIANEIMTQFPHIETILELGCARGYLIYRLREMGFNASGVEFSDHAVRTAHPIAMPHIHQLDLNDRFLGRFKRKQFDLIVSFDVLEHIGEEHIEDVIRECNVIGKNHYHQIETLLLPGDNDSSHVNIKPIEWWEERCKGWTLLQSRIPSSKT